MMKRDLTQRGVEKRQEKELRWSEIPDNVKEKFKEAEAQQWEEHLTYDALETLSVEESHQVRRKVPRENPTVKMGLQGQKLG